MSTIIDESTSIQDQGFQPNGHVLYSQSSPWSVSDPDLRKPPHFSLSVSDPGLISSLSSKPPHPTMSVSEDTGFTKYLEPHPTNWSLSDTGLRLRPTKGGSKLPGQKQKEEEHQIHNQGNHHYHGFEFTNKLFYILNTIKSKTPGNKEFLKWVFILLNVIVEVCQAALSQEQNDGKIGRKIYLKLSIITSCICLIMSLFEVFHEGKKYGVVWKKRGYCCWFYYPGNGGRLFGRVSLYFGVISSIIQLIINLSEEFTKKDVVKFDYMPLLLAICYLVAAMIGSGEKTTMAISIRCSVHGSFSDVEGTIIEGHENRVFQCPECLLGDPSGIDLC